MQRISPPNVEQLVAHTAKVTSLLTELATTQKHAQRLSLIADLVCLSVLADRAAAGLFRRGKKALSSTDHLSTQTAQELLHARSGTGYCIVELPTLELAIKTDQPVTEELLTEIKQYLVPFDVRYRRPWSLIAFVMAASLILLLPIRETMTADAMVIGDGGYTISAPNAGTLSGVNQRVGQVEKGNVIASIDNDAALREQVAKSDLASIDAQIQAQGLRSTENLSVLYLERKKAAAAADKAKEDANSNEITAPKSGLISWQPQLLGTWVQQSQILGVVHPYKQTNVQAMISQSDWIGAKINDEAVFITDDTKTKITGKLSSIPSEPIKTATGIEYQVDIQLTKPLPTGSTGRVAISGKQTNVGTWLLRRPLLHIKAWALVALQ